MSAGLVHFLTVHQQAKGNGFGTDRPSDAIT